MKTQFITDRGEIVGKRITVYHLLVDFLDPTKTESYLCKLYELSPEQVAAARAFILNHPDTVLARHLEIEKRIAAGNPPEVIEQAKRTHEAFLGFKQWLDERNGKEAAADSANGGFPAFREWFAQQESRPAEGS